MFHGLGILLNFVLLYSPSALLEIGFSAIVVGLIQQ
jgi:hypothetical protein